MNYKISPSDLTFLYEGCKRCFYMKVRYGLAQPSIPLPSIFTKIATLLKTYFDGKSTEALHIELPPGVVKYGEKWVESQSIGFSGHKDTCYIKGRFDVVISFDDRTYGVIDYKTGNPEGEFSRLYGRQLHAYAYALENSAPGAMHLAPISTLGLLYFHPSAISQNRTDWLSFDAEISLVIVERNARDFHNFIEEVLSLLELPKPPEPASECGWCNYLKKHRQL